MCGRPRSRVGTVGAHAVFHGLPTKSRPLESPESYFLLSARASDLLVPIVDFLCALGVLCGCGSVFRPSNPCPSVSDKPPYHYLKTGVVLLISAPPRLCASSLLVAAAGRAGVFVFSVVQEDRKKAVRGTHPTACLEYRVDAGQTESSSA